MSAVGSQKGQALNLDFQLFRRTLNVSITMENGHLFSYSVFQKRFINVDVTFLRELLSKSF